MHTRVRFGPATAFVAMAMLVVASARADRPAIEQTLRAIEKTVLAGDIDGYLAHVAADDPIFLKEQHNWAADLKHHVPTNFRLSIVDPPPPEQAPAEQPDGHTPDPKPAHDGVRPFAFDDAAGTATFEMRMDWTMTGIGRNKRDLTRTISYPVMFKRVRAADGTVPDRWVYAGETWSTIDDTPGPTPRQFPAPHAPADPEARAEHGDAPAPAPRSAAPNRCRYFPGFEQVSQRIIDVLPEVRAHVDEGFENPIAHVQEVKVYPSMLHLQASIYLSYADGLGGWNEPGESIKLLASNRSSADSLRVLLGHEYGHVATFEYGPHASDMPWWILEGVAELSSEHFAARRADGSRARRGRDAEQMVRAWARAGELADWADLTDFRTVKPALSGHVYKQGQHMVGYISERFGRSRRNAWLRAMARGATLDDATTATLGISFARLDADWRATLPAREDQSPVEGEQTLPPAEEPK
ncbi:MAG: hypothetical protein ACK4WH_10355 [Phycisphaerales bacterium]